MATYQLRRNRRTQTLRSRWVGIFASRRARDTVHVAGVATRSCVVPVSLIGDRPILTIEGIGQDRRKETSQRARPDGRKERRMAKQDAEGTCCRNLMS